MLLKSNKLNSMFKSLVALPRQVYVISTSVSTAKIKYTTKNAFTSIPRLISVEDARIFF